MPKQISIPCISKTYSYSARTSKKYTRKKVCAISHRSHHRSFCSLCLVYVVRQIRITFSSGGANHLLTGAPGVGVARCPKFIWPVARRKKRKRVAASCVGLVVGFSSKQILWKIRSRILDGQCLVVTFHADLHLLNFVDIRRGSVCVLCFFLHNKWAMPKTIQAHVCSRSLRHEQIILHP